MSSQYSLFMEKYISEVNFKKKEGDQMGKKVLIATIYNSDPVVLAITQVGADRVILLIDEKPNETQTESIKLIEKSFGNVIDIKTVKTKVYDVVEVAKKSVEIIDLTPKEDTIYINITSGRKPKAIGLLFGAYARCTRIKKISYNPDEETKGSVIFLPKLSFDLTESQRKVLEYIQTEDFKTHTELAEKISISRAMLYKNIKDLEDRDLINTEEGFKLTDAGKIALL